MVPDLKGVVQKQEEDWGIAQAVQRKIQSIILVKVLEKDGMQVNTAKVKEYGLRDYSNAPISVRAEEVKYLHDQPDYNEELEEDETVVAEWNVAIVSGESD